MGNVGGGERRGRMSRDERRLGEGWREKECGERRRRGKMEGREEEGKVTRERGDL